MINNVKLVFDNGDHICIPNKYIGRLFANTSHMHYAKVRSKIQRVKSIDAFCMEIFAEADSDEDYYHGYFNFGELTSFDRLMRWKDITSIEFVEEIDFVDVKEFCSNKEAESCEECEAYGECPYYLADKYVVDYREVMKEEGGENLFQKVYLSKLGNLYIVIGDGLEFEECFDKEEIDDKEKMMQLRMAYGDCEEELR